MIKHIFAKLVRTGSILVICAALLLYAPDFIQGARQNKTSTSKAERQLITVWLRGDPLHAADWVKKQAAAYQKAHKGVSIWLRTVSAADMALLAAQPEAAPDVLLFPADEAVDAAWFAEIGSLSVLGRHAACGQYEKKQLAVPLCMAGYALVMQTHSAAVTPAPTSLFGVTPTPDVLQRTATPVPFAQWPQKVMADNHLGAALLGLLPGAADAQLTEKEQVFSAFLQGQAQAALITTQQARTLSAQGKGMEVLAAAPASDLVLFGGVMQNAAPAAQDFLSYLLSEDAQRELRSCGLISARPQMHLYGNDTPVLQAAEVALKDGWLPNAFSWAAQRSDFIHTSQALYAAGQSTQTLFQ